MKIVFWSPVHGQAGVTSNILAVSLITGMHYRTKNILTQTQFNYNNLEAPLVGANAYNKDSKAYFREVGLDTIIRCFKAAKLDEVTLENCCITLENTNTLLLPGSSKLIKESFEFEIDAVIVNLLKSIEVLTGIIFVDICSGVNPLSKKLMSEADLVVVNLSQNMGVTDLFFKEYLEFITVKVFYLFGNYDGHSKYNISNIRRKYHRNITQKNSGVIPYNTRFMDSQVDGRTVEFIRHNLNCTKKDDNYYFMMKAKSATDKILGYAGVNTGGSDKWSS